MQIWSSNVASGAAQSEAHILKESYFLELVGFFWLKVYFPVMCVTFVQISMLRKILILMKASF